MNTMTLRGMNGFFQGIRLQFPLIAIYRDQSQAIAKKFWCAAFIILDMRVGVAKNAAPWWCNGSERDGIGDRAC